MKARHALTALLALSTLAVACDDDDEDPNGPPDTETLSADLNGANERPNPVNTAATGDADFTISTSGGTTTITYSVSVSGLSGPVTAAHIHGPAGPEQVAGPIVPLTVTSQSTSGVVVAGSFTTTGNANINIASLVQHMLAGNTYINLHTAANQDGEIRGQIID